MIFTDKFVYVHQPKTGGTFVTSVLFRLHEFQWNALTHLKSALKINVTHQNKYGTLVYNNNKHGGCSAIPASQRDKLILATVRNPYDLWVSQYEFGWWKRREFLKYFRDRVPDFDRRFPHFPNLTFDEYVRIAGPAFRELEGRDDIGLLTQQFLKFYFKEPDDEMYNVRFIRTDQLNQGLHEFLSEMGYAAEDIAFVNSLEKILPKGKGRPNSQKWQSFYTPELKNFVRTRERLLFEMFPEFDM